MYGLRQINGPNNAGKNQLVHAEIDSEPAYITALRREAYSNGLNAGSLLFLTPDVSQAASCDGTKITTTAEGQEIAVGTLPTY